MAFEQTADGLKSSSFKAHVLARPSRLTFDVFRPARKAFSHREEAFHVGY